MENKIDLVLVKKESSKKRGEYYFSLYLDYGVRKQVLVPYDSLLVSSILDCPISTLYDICKDIDKPVKVAFVDFNIDKE